MSDRSQSVDLAAAQEHAIVSRRTRVHVIICHDLDHRRHDLFEIFGLAGHVSPEVIAAIGRELAEDILQDVAILKGELDGIEAYARRQLAKLGES